MFEPTNNDSNDLISASKIIILNPKCLLENIHGFTMKQTCYETILQTK